MLLAESLLGSSSVDANFIEDVFSTWLYTGNSSTQTITNGIDLAGKGGLVWIKSRGDANDNVLYDTARGATFSLSSNLTASTATESTGLTSFLANGFSMGSASNINGSTIPYASWTFREQPRFFDIVTYTGNGANRTIAHNLGSVPGCIIVKRRDAVANWQVYHRSLANTQYMVLNRTDAVATGATRWNSATPTDTVFSLGTDATVNANGGTYVAYLFAHDAGGFGATGADNVISCGSFNNVVSGATVNLGYEPQFIIIKNSSAVTNWFINDNMRGMPVSVGNTAILFPNGSNAESTGVGIVPTATGFTYQEAAGNNAHVYIYIAIRRGPMRTPTTGTSVFSPIATNNPTGTNITTNFPIDFQISTIRNATTFAFAVDRLRGVSTNSTGYANVLVPQLTDAESGGPGGGLFWGSTGFQTPTARASSDAIYWNFRRAPGFFDVVCYTGEPTSVQHNLGVAPELIITKNRTASPVFPQSDQWCVGGIATRLTLNSTAARVGGSGSTQNATTFDATTVRSHDNYYSGIGGVNVVAYLFASCPGVSRVGTYTGTGATQVINCGFAAGARFVLIKRTDSTGDWYVWDSARGIVAANDPYLALNSTAAEVTNTDWVDTAASGFELSNAAGNLVNTNGGSYIFLAIA